MSKQRKSAAKTTPPPGKPGPGPRTAKTPAKAAAKATPGAKPLSAKHQAFVAEYVKDKNAGKAYLRVYGGSQDSAYVSGCRLLKNVHIAAEIDRICSEIVKNVQRETEITLERVVFELARSAFFDPRRFFDDKGGLRQITDLDDDTAMALAGFDVTEEYEGSGSERRVSGYTKKIKLADRARYLDMLMQHLGGYKKDREQANQPLAETLRTFFSALHNGAGRLPIARIEPRPTNVLAPSPKAIAGPVKGWSGG